MKGKIKLKGNMMLAQSESHGAQSDCRCGCFGPPVLCRSPITLSLLLLFVAIVWRAGSCSCCSRPSRSSKQTSARSAPGLVMTSGPCPDPIRPLFLFPFCLPPHLTPLTRSIRLLVLASRLQFMRPAHQPRRKSRRTRRLQSFLLCCVCMLKPHSQRQFQLIFKDQRQPVCTLIFEFME